MYIEQFCLAALFFLSISKGLAFIVEGILMIILMGLTLSAQLLFRHSFNRELTSSMVYNWVAECEQFTAITQHLPMS